MFGLLDPNDAGKSVLLKLLAGVLGPSSGRILWSGLPRETHLAAFKCRLGYMPQEPTFFEDQSVGGTSRYFARLKAIPARMVKERVEEMLHLLRLEAVAHRRVRHLSKGERSRLALAVALLNDPDWLILDEPGANLGSEERLRLWESIGRLKVGRAVVMATHVFAGLEGRIDRLLLLESGSEVVEAGAPQAQVAAHVWEVSLPAGVRPTWPPEALVIHADLTANGRRGRLLAAEQPVDGAERAAPTLEDAHLWLRRRGREDGGDS